MVWIGGEEFVAKGPKRQRIGSNYQEWSRMGSNQWWWVENRRRMGWELKQHFKTIENRWRMGWKSATNGSGAETTLQNHREWIKNCWEWILNRQEWGLNHRESMMKRSKIGDEWVKSLNNTSKLSRMGREPLRMEFESSTNGNRREWVESNDEWFGIEIKWLLGGFWLK